VAGAGYYFLSQGDNVEKVKDAAKDARSKAKEVENKAKSAAGGATGKYTFTGGDQGWVGLRLESVENYNHNTKKFRFKLPEDDQVSGLHVASAILTKFKGPTMDKPAIRPYTPTSDECEYIIFNCLIWDPFTDYCQRRRASWNCWLKSTKEVSCLLISTIWL
jgi:cytochrome-b5 reductase